MRDPGGSKELIESFPTAPCSPAGSNLVTYSSPKHTQNRTLYTRRDTYRTTMLQQLMSNQRAAGLKQSRHRSDSPELGWTQEGRLTPSRGRRIRPLATAKADGQQHIQMHRCLYFHATHAEADPFISLITPVQLELAKSAQEEPRGVTFCQPPHRTLSTRRG